jgi:hypothetical protein
MIELPVQRSIDPIDLTEHPMLSVTTRRQSGTRLANVTLCWYLDAVRRVPKTLQAKNARWENVVAARASGTLATRDVAA